MATAWPSRAASTRCTVHPTQSLILGTARRVRTGARTITGRAITQLSTRLRCPSRSFQHGSAVRQAVGIEEKGNWFLLSLAVSPLLSAVFLIAAGAAVRPPVCVGPVVVPNRAPALTALGIVAAVVTIAVAAFIAFTGTPDVGGVSTVAKSPNWQDLFQPGEE